MNSVLQEFANSVSVVDGRYKVTADLTSEACSIIHDANSVMKWASRSLAK